MWSREMRIWLIGVVALALANGSAAQDARKPAEACCVSAKEHGQAHDEKVPQPLSPEELFAARVRMILGSGEPAKGDWGLLIADALSGQVLFELNADKYYVPASNMKLFTTALALAKLGP